MAKAKSRDYCKFFDTEDEAIAWCEMLNKACKAAGNKKDVYAMVCGPEDNFAVVDYRVAIDMEMGYSIFW